MRHIYLGVEETFDLLFKQLRQSTRASEKNCREVANRLSQEVTRICQQSKRIQSSGEVEVWAKNLANHRLQQCLRYYQLGSNRGRIELQSTLSAIVYRYISPAGVITSYRVRLTLIEDFLQGFYAEALNAFRREAQMQPSYSPRTLLELAEYMAFCERYGKRRIPLPGKRSQQLIILRAQTFSQQQPKEANVDMSVVAEGGSGESDRPAHDPTVQQLRSILAEQTPTNTDSGVRETIIKELISYLEERNQSECIDYFILRLKDCSAKEIEHILGLTPRKRDYLQQRFKYHLIRFALSHRWELVHQWLDADLDKNLGLTPRQWELFTNKLDEQQLKLLELKQQKVPHTKIAKILACTVTQADKKWFKLLELAWDIRNRPLSGSSVSQDE